MNVCSYSAPGNFVQLLSGSQTNWMVSSAWKKNAWVLFSQWFSWVYFSDRSLCI